MNCNLEHINDRLVCSKCGFSMKFREGNVLRNCDSAPKPELPGLMAQATHLAKDIYEWGKNGFQVAPQSERERRLAICQSCELFTDGRCSKCGCACAWSSFLDTKTCPHPKGDKWKVDNDALSC